MSDTTAAARVSDAAAPARPAGRLVWGEPLRRLLLVAVGLLAVAAALVIPLALHVKGVSPFDETTHADYAWQISHGHIPARGDILSAPIRADVACRGLAREDPHAAKPQCGSRTLQPDYFGAGGQNYNFGHPPLYYLLTGVFARLVSHPFSGAHFITAARFAGALWLFAAMLVLYLALRRLAVRWEFAVCGGLLLACVPGVLYAESTVTNDAAATLGGSLAVWLAARIFAERRYGWVVPTVVTLAVTATKIVNALPELALAALLLVLAWRRNRTERGSGRQLIAPAVGMIAGAFVVYEGWSLFQKHRGVAHWVNPIGTVSTLPVHGLPLNEWFSTSFSSYNILGSYYLPGQADNQWIGALVRLTGVLSIAAVGALLARHDRWSPRFVVGAIATLGCLTYPWAVELQAYLSSSHPHRYFPAVVPRYGLSFASVLVAALVLAVDDRRLRKTLYWFSAAALAVVTYTAFAAT